MGSIHSQTDQDLVVNTSTSAQALFASKNSVYIGLITSSDITNLTWTDGTNFDYGSNISKVGVNPWASSQPSGNDGCTRLYKGQDYLWDVVPCSNIRRLLCNSCNGILNKYLVCLASDKDYVSAKTSCQQKGTILASFHSQRDYQELVSLCQLDVLDSNIGCWIGLSDANNEGQWIFEDGTTLIYGRNTSGGIYPWSIRNVPQLEEEDYARMDELDEYRLVYATSNMLRYAICNVPSEICGSVGNWNVFKGNNMNFADCEMTVSYNGLLNVGMNIERQYWNGVGGNLLIDYLYNMNMSIMSGGAAGIIISDDQCPLKYYMIGITKVDDNYYVFLEYINGVSYKLAQTLLPFVIENNIDYLLSIDIKSVHNITNRFIISINEVEYISYPHTQNDHNLIHSGWSGYIGIFSETSMTAKSLYASGTALKTSILTNCMDIIANNVHIITQAPTSEPSAHPTTDPTTNPTVDPTVDPTSYPTTDPTTSAPTTNPTHDPTKYPTFDPTNNPSNPTLFPSRTPTNIPTVNPTTNPTTNPIINEQEIPNENPTVTQNVRNGTASPNASEDIAKDVKMLLLIFGVCIALLCIIIGILLGICIKKRRKWEIDRAEITNISSNDRKNIKQKVVDTVEMHKMAESKISLPIHDEMSKSVDNADIEDMYSEKDQNHIPAATPGYITKGESEKDSDSSFDEQHTITPGVTTKCDDNTLIM